MAQVCSAILFLLTSAAVSPTEFGEFAIATSIFLALATCVGHGTYEYIIKARESKTAVPTVFLLNLASATLMTIAVAAIIGVIPHIVDGPAIPKLLALLSPAFFLMALNTLMEGVALKHGEVTKVGVASIASETVALIAALAALYGGAGIYALVIQRLIREGTITCIYGLTSRWEPRILFDVNEAKWATKFALAIVTTRFIQMGSSAGVDLIVGARLSVADAGLFRLVTRLLTVGSDVLYQPFRAAMWVSLPPLQKDHEAFSRTAFYLLEVFGVGLFATMAGSALIAAPAFDLAFSPDWQRAVPVVYAIALARLFTLPQMASEFVFALKSRMTIMTTGAIVSSLLGIGAALLSAPGGLYVFAAAQIAVSIINQLWIVPIMSTSGHMAIPTLLSLMGRLSLNIIAMMAIAGPWCFVLRRDGWADIPVIVSTIVIGALVYILAARKFTPAGYRAYADALADGGKYCRRVISSYRAKEVGD